MPTSIATLPTKGSIGDLNKLIEVADLFRDVHPDMTLNQMVVFLLIAANAGITQRQIMERTGLADSSASRIISILGKWGNRGTKPLLLVDVVYDEIDRRTRTYRINANGRKLLDKIAAAMAKGRASSPRSRSPKLQSEGPYLPHDGD